VIDEGSQHVCRENLILLPNLKLCRRFFFFIRLSEPQQPSVAILAALALLLDAASAVGWDRLAGGGGRPRRLALRAVASPDISLDPGKAPQKLPLENVQKIIPNKFDIECYIVKYRHRYMQKVPIHG
jgi:hypothetical protein